MFGSETALRHSAGQQAAERAPLAAAPARSRLCKWLQIRDLVFEPRASASGCGDFFGACQGDERKGGTYEIEYPGIQISEITEHHNIEKARVPRWGGEPWKERSSARSWL
jgi:hypothetical protein